MSAVQPFPERKGVTLRKTRNPMKMGSLCQQFKGQGVGSCRLGQELAV